MITAGDGFHAWSVISFVSRNANNGNIISQVSLMIFGEAGPLAKREWGMTSSGTIGFEVFVAPLSPQAILPHKAHATDAGFDLAIPAEQTLEPHGQMMIDLEFALEIPPGWYGQVFGRSSVFQRGMSVHPGVIDADYRGSIRLLIRNEGSEPQYLQRGERLAQLMFLPVPDVTLTPVAPEALSATARGQGGIGSTGR